MVIAEKRILSQGWLKYMRNIESLPAILASLSEPFPEHLLQHKPQRDKKNGTTTYLTSIAWHTACQRLDDVYPYWSQNVEKVEIIGSMVVATVSISLHFTDGMVTRTNTGIEEISTDSWGDPVSNAIAMGFKRAAALFGIARYLYHKDVGQSQSYPTIANASQAQYPQSYAPSGSPLQDPNPAMATDGQRKAIYAIARVMNQTYDRFTNGKKLEQLTKAEAIKIIDFMSKEKDKMNL